MEPLHFVLFGIGQAVLFCFYLGGQDFYIVEEGTLVALKKRPDSEDSEEVHMLPKLKTDLKLS